MANEIRIEIGYDIAKYGKRIFSYLIVESDDDIKFFNKFIHEEKCKLQMACNKTNLLELIELLEKSRINGILGVVDCDFDKLECVSYSSPNIILTDDHDHNTMCFKSDAFKTVLNEYSSITAIKDFKEEYNVEIKEKIIKMGLEIGYLRLLSLRDNFRLDFKIIKYSNFFEFINKDSFKLDFIKLINTVLKNTKYWPLIKSNYENSYGERVDLDFLLKKISELIDPEHDPYQICNGHDLIKILYVGLKLFFGINLKPLFSFDDLESAFRIAYTFDYFSQTALFSYILEWEQRNTGFLILNQK